MTAEPRDFGLARIGTSVLGLPRESMSEVCRLTGLNPLMVGSSLILDDHRSVSIIGLDAIFARPGVLSGEAPQVAHSRGFDSGRIPMLIFEVGGAKFSIEAEEV